MSISSTDDSDFYSDPKRKYMEINEMLSSGNSEFIDYSLKLKEAMPKAMENCINNNSEYSIFSHLEGRSIEIEERDNREHKHQIQKLNKFNKGHTYQTNREAYQIWNRDENSINYPQNLIDHSMANNFYQISENNFFMRENIKEEDENVIKEKSEGHLPIINKYYRYELLKDLIKK